MKKLFLILLLCTAVAVACSKDGKVTEPVLKISNTESLVSVKNTACKESVKITTNQKWDVTVTPNVDWITLTKNKETLNIDIQENNTDKEREAEITITAGKLSEKIKVKQMPGKIKEDDPKPEDPKPEDPVDSTLNVSKSVINAKAEGIEETVTITTNQDSWSFEKASEITWITLTKENNNLKIVVEANSNKDSREAVVTVKAGELAKNITIKQEGKEESQGGNENPGETPGENPGETPKSEEEIVREAQKYDSDINNFNFEYRVIATVATSVGCQYCPQIKEVEEKVLNSPIKDSIVFTDLYIDGQFQNADARELARYLFYCYNTPKTNLDFSRRCKEITSNNSEVFIKQDIRRFFEWSQLKHKAGLAAQVSKVNDKQIKVKVIVKSLEARDDIKLGVWIREDSLTYEKKPGNVYNRVYVGGKVSGRSKLEDYMGESLGNVKAKGYVIKEYTIDVPTVKNIDNCSAVIFLTAMSEKDRLNMNVIDCKVGETKKIQYTK